MLFAVGSVRPLASLLLAFFCSQSAVAAPGDLLSTSKTNVNVRSEPSTNAGIVTRIDPGETVVEVSSVRDWYRVRLPSQDREGWVFAPLMTAIVALEPEPAPVQPTTPTARATAPQPPVQAGSSASERLLARLDRFDDNLIGNPARGETLFAKCGSCHTTVAGVHAQGPSLVGVFGRSPAQAWDYKYSGSMQAFARNGAVWDAATLDRFIQRPARIVKGTSMPFSGIRDPQDRRDVIAFLEQLSR